MFTERFAKRRKLEYNKTEFKHKTNKHEQPSDPTEPEMIKTKPIEPEPTNSEPETDGLQHWRKEYFISN